MAAVVIVARVPVGFADNVVDGLEAWVLGEALLQFQKNEEVFALDSFVLSLELLNLARVFIPSFAIFLIKLLAKCHGSGVALAGGCDEAELRFIDDIFDRGRGLVLEALCGEVGAGGLQAVEQKAGALGVDPICGNPVEDFADGELHGGSVFGAGQDEFVAAKLARAGLFAGDGLTGGVMVVAEVLGAERGRGAAMAVGKDVAADVANVFCLLGFGLVFGMHNGSLPQGYGALMDEFWALGPDVAVDGGSRPEGRLFKYSPYVRLSLRWCQGFF